MRTSFLRLMVFFLILFFSSLSCSLPISGQQATPGGDHQGTIAALQTQVQQSTSPVPPTEVPHSPPATETSVPEPTPTDLPQNRYRGFIAWNQFQFSAYDFSGASLGFQVPSGPEEWYGENRISILPNAIYYSTFGQTSGVFRVDSSGTTQLNFIDASEPVSLSVSPDGGLIAWATNQWDLTGPASDIFIANMDGSSIRLVEHILAEEQENGWLIFHPLRWTEDGKLLYATGPTGIGGYLLFWGYNGLRLYDPVQSSTQVLVNDDENLGLCLSALSDDYAKIALVCGNGTRMVRVRNLSNGLEVQFPLLPDQNNSGSASFSPDGEWLAYVIQRMDPENEFGQVVVVPVDGSAPPQVIDQVVDGIYNVDGWIDNQTILVTKTVAGANTSIWKIASDGSSAAQLINGRFVGFYP